MKIAFSTVGCPEWSWNEIYSMAKDLGFDGIEIRGLGDEISATKTAPFSTNELNKTMSALGQLGLEIVCFSSSCCLRGDTENSKVLAEGFEYIELASKAKTKYVRILGDKEPSFTGEVDDEAVISSLKILSSFAEYKNVTLLIETNGVYANSARLNKVIEDVSSPYVQVLWDIHHT